MSMFDDLDPDFISSPGPALPLVAARVYAIRKRRWIITASACGAVVVAMLAATTFGGGGDPDQLTVAREVTTTTEETSSTIDVPLITAPTSSSTSTTAATSSTTTLPAVSDTTTTSPDTTTTVPTPARLTATLDRERLVMRSGTIATVSYTVTNDGDKAGRFEIVHTGCPPESEQYRSIWPEEPSNRIAWPSKPEHVTCPYLRMGHVEGHETRTFSVTVVAGEYRGKNQLVPAPPGEVSLRVLRWHWTPGGLSLPVTITPPATPPLTIDHPSEITTASGDQHDVDFTITNHLSFPVEFESRGPCAQGGEDDCVATFPNSARDLRVAPYAKADVPLWTTRFELGANETRMATAVVDGVIDLDDRGSGSPALPPGVYRFDWNGEKVKFTVTQ